MFPLASLFRRARHFCPLLALAVTATLPGMAHAQSMVPTVIVDALTGEVLHSESATRPWFPASTTKLMTAYVALREIRAGNIRLDTPIVASQNAAKQRPSKIGIKPGQEITLENALKVMMVKSANDIAVVVAEGVGGSVTNFSAMMNREARRIGMQESNWTNPHGWEDARQYTSARDMAILARTVLTEFPEYRDLWSIGAVKLGNTVFRNTNGLIGRYSGAIGMKTGYICASGFNLVSAAERNGRTLIAVVFGAATGPDRALKAAQLLDQGFGAGGGGFFGRSTGGRSLESLAASSETSAPNRRADICRKGAPPASDVDDFAGVSAQPDPHVVDNPSRMIGLMHRTSEAASVGQRDGNRIILGPRATFEPLLVYLGRKPGSTEVARRPGAPDAAATTTAFAAAPRQARANGAPLALPGVMTSPAASSRIGAARTAPTRPAARASLANRPANAAARPASAPRQAIDPAKRTDAKAKAEAKAKAQPQAVARKKLPPKAAGSLQ